MSVAQLKIIPFEILNTANPNIFGMQNVKIQFMYLNFINYLHILGNANQDIVLQIKIINHLHLEMIFGTCVFFSTIDANVRLSFRCWYFQYRLQCQSY
jgi:hypothetical protein